MVDAKVLLCSPYNTYPLSFNAITYEFCKVASDLSDCDLLAPPPLQSGQRYRHAGPIIDKAGRELRRAYGKFRNQLGLVRLPAGQPVQVKEKYDLFFYACSFVHDLSNLDNIYGWEKCSRFRVAFIMESWSHLLKDQKGYMKYLDHFDHVFLLNASSIPNVQRMTRAPCTFLPLAADCVAASPLPNLPARSIDVYSMGRRAPAVHRQLCDAMQKNELFYLFDPTHSGVVIDWAESRQMTSDLIKRSRYFVTFDHTVGSELKMREASGEIALSMRYFEGAAGGAVMIGSKPRCSEFSECFDWPDSVLEIPVNPDDTVEILRGLDSDEERLKRIRRTNVIESHLRHDWSHRWQEVLAVCGFPPTSAIAERQGLLKSWAKNA